jgi:hypothetical protein
VSPAYHMKLLEGLRNEEWKFDERQDPVFTIIMCNTFPSFCIAGCFEVKRT